MKTPLVKAEILSIYMKNDTRLFLPARMAQCTPDMQRAIYAIKNDLEAVSGNLYLSDLFRSYDMQQQAYLDYKTGKKQAYSPPPGGSMHEAGRAFDLDLDNLKITLQDFWKIADEHGCKPIITAPDSSAKEAWHFDYRGSHQLVYEYYTNGKGTNLKPYEAMAISAILAIGIQVDKFSGKEKEAAIQSGLIRLGYEIGNIDGIIGFKTNQALETAGVSGSDMDSLLLGVENLLQQKFPDEYRVDIMTDSGENGPPPNVIG